jgi:mannosyl-glycoprotein endo-beta-N-acetylglucosaminidase
LPNGVFDSTYKYSDVNYTELTDGFTSSIQGTITYTFSSVKTLDAGKYRLLVYVKNAGVQGEHSNIYTDYDNFYTDYVRVLEKNSVENS